MSTLTISNVSKGPNGRLEMTVRRGGPDEILWFQLPSGFQPHSDHIATCIAAIFGQAFNVIEFLEPISEACKKEVSKVTASEWKTPTPYIPPSRVADSENVMLNFSGGFDSLAALAILGERAKMVSIDFGGAFSRERRFFSDFPTVIIETNAREFQSSWTFMGIGSILLRDYFETQYFAFGTILEASPWNFLKRTSPLTTHPIFKAAGLRNINPVVGLSEFATTQLAAQCFPDKVRASLDSLADPNSEKFIRKSAMLASISHTAESTINVDPQKCKPLQYGHHLAQDFLAMGMFKFCPEYAENWMTPPRGLKTLVSELKLDFYWRENPDLWFEMPEKISRQIAGTKAELGVKPYQSSDWKEYSRVLQSLRLHHIFPGNIE